VELTVIAHLPTGFVDSSFPDALPIGKLNLPLAKLSAASEVPLSLDPQSSPTLKQYLLVCHARSLAFNTGVWCFSLESMAGEPILDAECEEEGDLNRLSLLAAVRGLEAIDGRGLVSLISNNRYLIRSLDRSLPRWRENDFVWEQFGRKMPVQNADLWKRIDRTLSIHCVTASLLQSTRVSTGDSRFDTLFGPAARTSTARNEDTPILRRDGAHSSVSAPAGSFAVANPPHVANGSVPSDGLRRWLADNCDAAPVVTRRGRYRAADLADA
jgi:ribonuclease HI